MKQPFTLLNRSDVQKLRRKPMVASNAIIYDFKQTDVDAMVKHLKTLYDGEIRETFAAKILLNNKIY